MRQADHLLFYFPMCSSSRNVIGNGTMHGAGKFIDFRSRHLDNTGAKDQLMSARVPAYYPYPFLCAHPLAPLAPACYPDTFLSMHPPPFWPMSTHCPSHGMEISSCAVFLPPHHAILIYEVQVEHMNQPGGNPALLVLSLDGT